MNLNEIALLENIKSEGVIKILFYNTSEKIKLKIIKNCRRYLK